VRIMRSCVPVCIRRRGTNNKNITKIVGSTANDVAYTSACALVCVGSHAPVHLRIIRAYPSLCVASKRPLKNITNIVDSAAEKNITKIVGSRVRIMRSRGPVRTCVHAYTYTYVHTRPALKILQKL